MKEGWKRKGGREGGRRKVSCEVSRPFREHKSLPYKVNNLNRHIKEKLPDRREAVSIGHLPLHAHGDSWTLGNKR